MMRHLSQSSTQAAEDDAAEAAKCLALSENLAARWSATSLALQTFQAMPLAEFKNRGFKFNGLEERSLGLTNTIPLIPKQLLISNGCKYSRERLRIYAISREQYGAVKP